MTLKIFQKIKKIIKGAVATKAEADLGEVEAATLEVPHLWNLIL